MRGPVAKFCTNMETFNRRTARRFVVELAIVLAIAFYFVVAGWNQLPAWISVSTGLIILAWILSDIVSANRAREFAKKYWLCFYDDALSFYTGGENSGQIKYSELRFHSVVRKKGEIRMVCLITLYNQKIRLEGLNDMARLYLLVDEKIRTE